MHLYNAWLPGPILEECWKEKEAFSGVVNSLKLCFLPQDPDSVYSTLKWISVLDLFIKAKSDVSLEDVGSLVQLGLDIFYASSGKLYVQVRWGNLLVRIINKFRNKLSLTLHWRPLYDILLRTHFSRNTGPEGWRIKQRHFETLTALVRACRRFFPPNSAFQTWSEFGSLLENPWHNSAFEGSGFIKLFLPTNLDNQDFFSLDWIGKCIQVWSSIPNCQFWNSQWAAVLAPVIKNYDALTWEPLLPVLFAKYLNMFEMRPNYHSEGLFSESKVNINSKIESRSNPITQLWHASGKCPESTIPIRRIKKEDVLRANSVKRYGRKKYNRFAKPRSQDHDLVNKSGHQVFSSFLPFLILVLLLFLYVYIALFFLK